MKVEWVINLVAVVLNLWCTVSAKSHHGWRRWLHRRERETENSPNLATSSLHNTRNITNHYINSPHQELYAAYIIDALESLGILSSSKQNCYSVKRIVREILPPLENPSDTRIAVQMIFHEKTLPAGVRDILSYRPGLIDSEVERKLHRYGEYDHPGVDMKKSRIPDCILRAPLNKNSDHSGSTKMYYKTSLGTTTSYNLTTSSENGSVGISGNLVEQEKIGKKRAKGLSNTQIMVIVTCSVVIGGFFVVAMVLRIRNYIKRTQENYRGRFGRSSLCTGSKDSLSKVSDHGKTKKEKIKFKDAFIHMDPHEHFECPDNMANTPKVGVETHPLLVVTTPPSPIAGSSLDQPHQNQQVASAVKKETKHKEPKRDNLVDDKDVDRERSTLEYTEESETPRDIDKPETAAASAISAVPSKVTAPVPPAISMEQIILKSLGHVNVGLTQSETSLNSINPSYRYGNQFEYGSYHGGGIHLPHGHSQSSLQGSDDDSVIHKEDSPPVTEESNAQMSGHETTCLDVKESGPEKVSTPESIKNMTSPAEVNNSICVIPLTNINENNQIRNEELRNVGGIANSQVNEHKDGIYDAKDEYTVCETGSKLMAGQRTEKNGNGLEFKNADNLDAHSVMPQGTQVISDQQNIIPPKNLSFENMPSIDRINETAGISNINGLATTDTKGSDTKVIACPISSVGEISTIGNGRADMNAGNELAEQDRKSGQCASGYNERNIGDLTVSSGNIDIAVLKTDFKLPPGDTSKKATEKKAVEDSPALIPVEETGSILIDPCVKGHNPSTKGHGECRLIDLDEMLGGPVIGMEDMEDDSECHDPLLEKIIDHQGKSNSESTESLTKEDDKACFLKQLDQMQSTFL